MRKTLILILIFFPLTLLGQDLDSCKTKDDIKNLLIGYWKDSEINSENVIHFWSEKDKLILDNVKINNEHNEYDSISIHFTFVKIKKNGRKYKLQFISLYSSSKAKIKFLDKQKMILKRNGKEEVYSRIME